MSNSSADSFDEYLKSLSRAYDSSYFYLYPIIIAAGLLGNAFCSITLCRRWSSLHNHHIPYIFQGFSDFGTLTLRIFSVIAVAEKKFPGLKSPVFSNALSCKSYAYFYAIFNSMSSGILGVAGVDRFLAIRFPFQHKQISKGMIVKACLGYTLISGLMAIVCPIWWIHFPSLRSCYFSFNLPVGLQIGLQMYINLVVNGLVGCTITLVLNSYLAHVLRKASKSRAELSGGLSRNERKAVITLLITALINVACCLPKSVVFMAASGFYYFKSNPTKLEFQMGRLLLVIGDILNTLYYINCAINWVPVAVNYKLFGRQKQANASMSRGTQQ